MRSFVLSFLLFSGVSGWGQIADTLLPNLYGTWHVKHWVHDPWDDWEGTYISLFYDIYDTISWNGQTWNLVYVDGTDGLMRSDSGKVYCRGWFEPLPLQYAPADTSEKILYDFNMEPGDTAYFDYLNPAVVESIGTSNILGVSRKAWILDNHDTIVQGLGSVKGLFRPWKSLFETNEWICQFQGTYKDTLGTTTTLSFSTEACFLDMEETGDHLITYTPATGELWISLIRQDQLMIYSSDGKLIYDSWHEAGETGLNLEHLNNGLYIFRTGSGYTKKFLITK